MSNMVVVYCTCAIGIVMRTLVPYLQQLRDNPNMPFDRKFLIPAVVSVLLSLVLLPFVAANIPENADWIIAYIAGWGITDQARELMKFVGTNVDTFKFLR